ncbi:PadR family transcriptional regulator [Suicoccus acidiformans]|uniref:PadR family transcriptional regulator n=1 Tax=Suicoccus acidiformans TaxID=2036206 RepID=A0A347WL05_9LACT|nr:PadR family transcriptional regulator [Suicoccus acidiformans]AXY25762.1 PadR family transcriptional regulator [Suicoccus acidiformans]
MENNLQKHIPLTETMFLVLFTMLEENYGYKVSQDVEEITNGRIILGPGTLYGAINNLNKKGWIKLVNKDNSGKKVYIATDIGRELVSLEIKRMRNLVLKGEKKVKKEEDYE